MLWYGSKSYFCVQVVATMWSSRIPTSSLKEQQIYKSPTCPATFRIACSMLKAWHLHPRQQWLAMYGVRPEHRTDAGPIEHYLSSQPLPVHSCGLALASLLVLIAAVQSADLATASVYIFSYLLGASKHGLAKVPDGRSLAHAPQVPGEVRKGDSFGIPLLWRLRIVHLPRSPPAMELLRQLCTVVAPTRPLSKTSSRMPQESRGSWTRHSDRTNCTAWPRTKR